MAESIDSDACYECDGKIKKSDEKDERLKSKVECNMPDEAQEEKRRIIRRV